MNLKLLTSLLVPVLGFAAFRALNKLPTDTIQIAMASDPALRGSKFSDPAVLAEVDKIRKIAEVPRPAAAAAKTGWAMAWMHLVIWNAWKSAYFYADKYPKDDFHNYRAYATEAVKFLVDHHDAEEETLFPMLEKKIPGSMAKNEEQHQSFLKPLGELYSYVQTATAEKFDPVAFRSQMDAVLFPIMEHLAEELDSLAADALSAKMTEEELTEVNLATHKAQQASSDNKIALPFVVQNLPPGCEFPPAPGFVKNIIGPWMLYWKHAGLWKYTAYPWKATLPETVPLL